MSRRLWVIPLSILDPFGLGYTGRWLDATGRTIGRNSERTAKNDYKFDLRISKTVRTLRGGRMRLQGIVEGFNLLNTKNVTNYNGVFGARTYLQAGNSTNIFYQPRQVQLGFRITY